jgi:hypothetical protein
MEDITNLITAFISPDNDEINRGREYVDLHCRNHQFYENLLGVVFSPDFNSSQKQVASTLLYTQFKLHKK